jgi:DNA-binding PadR family transcriptional regulator
MFDDYWDFYRRHRHDHHHHHGFGSRRRGPVIPPMPRGPVGGMRGIGGDFFGFGPFGPPPRAERGGVRYLILDAIADQPRHGYDVIQAISERSGGTYKPSPGVVYPTLQMLEEMGHATLGGGPGAGAEREARKVYAITDEGRRDLEEHRHEVTDFYDRSAPQDWGWQFESFHDLKHELMGSLRSFKRAALHGRLSADVQDRVIEIVRDALRRIDDVLRESEAGRDGGRDRRGRP